MEERSGLTVNIIGASLSEPHINESVMRAVFDTPYVRHPRAASYIQY